MSYRKGHGTGAGRPHIEVLPIDELPDGLPAPARTESPTDRHAGGRFAPGNRIAAEGGNAKGAKAANTKLASELGLAKQFGDPQFAPYYDAANAFARAQLRELADTVGAGRVGPGPGSIVQSAALQLAASRYAFEVLNDPALGSRLADASRQNLLAAHELCAREAQIRGKKRSNPMHERILGAGRKGTP